MQIKANGNINDNSRNENKKENEVKQLEHNLKAKQL